MSLNRIFVLFAVVAIAFVGYQAVQIGVTYVQVQNVVDTKALDARMDDLSEEDIRWGIVDHMNTLNTDLPYEMVVGVSGLEHPEDTVRIELEYTDELNLHFWVIPIDITVVGTAAPPQE